AQGCPRAHRDNSLVRQMPHFHSEGFATALVDAPSDHPEPDGLGAFRTSPAHAEDLGKVIADVRARTKSQVWLVGTSRGTISAVIAAARLTGASAPDGLVLTSAITVPGKGAQRPWAAQSVFDANLGAIRIPVLVVGHARDTCLRTPPSGMNSIVARLGSARKQAVTVSGGSAPQRDGLEACEVGTPHAFLGQEAPVAAGMARFIRGGTY